MQLTEDSPRKSCVSNKSNASKNSKQVTFKDYELSQGNNSEGETIVGKIVPTPNRLTMQPVQPNPALEISFSGQEEQKQEPTPTFKQNSLVNTLRSPRMKNLAMKGAQKKKEVSPAPLVQQKPLEKRQSTTPLLKRTAARKQEEELDSIEEQPFFKQMKHKAKLQNSISSQNLVKASKLQSNTRHSFKVRDLNLSNKKEESKTDQNVFGFEQEGFSSNLDHSKASIQTAFFKKGQHGSVRQSSQYENALKSPELEDLQRTQATIREEQEKSSSKLKKYSESALGRREDQKNKKYLQDLMKKHKNGTVLSSQKKREESAGSIQGSPSLPFSTREKQNNSGLKGSSYQVSDFSVKDEFQNRARKSLIT